MDIGRIALMLGLVIFIATGIFIGSSKLPRRTTRIISALMIIVGAALVFGGQWWLTPLFSKAFNISQIIYFEGKNGKTLFVFNEGGFTDRMSSLRLSVLNADTGELLGKETVGTGGFSVHDNTELVAVTNDKVWLDDYDHRLHARDPYTGKMALTPQQVAEKYPTLDPSKNVRSGPTVEVKTDDGYVFKAQPPYFGLELKSFPAYTFNTTDTLFHTLRPDKNTDECMMIGDQKAICLKHVFEIDHDQHVKVLMSGHKESRRSYGVDMDERINNTLKLREAFFVVDSKLNNPKSLLIGHTEVDKEYYNQFELTRFDMKGRIIWTIKPGTDSNPGQISLHNGMIYLTIKGRILAYDAKTGTKRWEVQL